MPVGDVEADVRARLHRIGGAVVRGRPNRPELRQRGEGHVRVLAVEDRFVRRGDCGRRCREDVGRLLCDGVPADPGGDAEDRHFRTRPQTARKNACIPASWNTAIRR